MKDHKRRHGARWLLQGIKGNITHATDNPDILLSAVEKGTLRSIARTIEYMLYKDEFWGKPYKDALEEQKHERR